jgi:hypothetical protein
MRASRYGPDHSRTQSRGRNRLDTSCARPTDPSGVGWLGIDRMMSRHLLLRAATNSGSSQIVSPILSDVYGTQVLDVVRLETRAQEVDRLIERVQSSRRIEIRPKSSTTSSRVAGKPGLRDEQAEEQRKDLPSDFTTLDRAMPDCDSNAPEILDEDPVRQSPSEPIAEPTRIATASLLAGFLEPRDICCVPNDHQQVGATSRSGPDCDRRSRRVGALQRHGRREASATTALVASSSSFDSLIKTASASMLMTTGSSRAAATRSRTGQFLSRP